MSECLISVIIPIYNTEQFLKTCLDSLRAQTFHDFEAIMVDDGSTDGSGEICREYVGLDSRFRMIQQENSGVSVARNRALEDAKGRFVFFLDSDDFLPDDALENMIHVDADLVIGSICEVDESAKLNGKSQFLHNQVLTSEQALEILFDESVWGYQGYLFNKLYKRSIIEKHSIRFDSEIRYNEDRLFLVEYLLSCSEILLVSSIVYYYRQQENSALAQINRGFSPAFLTELDAFEKMKTLVEEKYPNIYFIICRLAFEKSLYWLKKIPEKYFQEKKTVRSYVRGNARSCLKIRGKGIVYKIKLIMHCILER